MNVFFFIYVVIAEVNYIRGGWEGNVPTTTTTVGDRQSSIVTIVLKQHWQNRHDELRTDCTLRDPEISHLDFPPGKFLYHSLNV